MSIVPSRSLSPYLLCLVATLAGCEGMNQRRSDDPKAPAGARVSMEVKDGVLVLKSENGVALDAGEVLYDITYTGAGYRVQGTRVRSEKENTTGDTSGSVTTKQVTNLGSDRWLRAFEISPDKQTVLMSITRLAPSPDPRVPSFASNLWSQAIVGSGSLTRVTTGDYFDNTPCYSPDGKSIYFSSNRTGEPAIWRRFAAGQGGYTKVTDSSTIDYAPMINRAGTHIVYTCESIVGGKPQIATMPVAGGLPTLIKPGQTARWSPDQESRELLITAADPNNGNSVIWRIDATGAEHQITDPSFNAIDPDWSPSGKEIVFASDKGLVRGERNYDIWKHDLVTGKESLLTDNASVDDNPRWLNETTILFRSNRGGQWNVWMREQKDEAQ